MKRLITVGALLGIAWSSGMRAWMQQLAGSESRFTWYTVGALIIPAAVVGALLGLAEHRRRIGSPDARFLLGVVPLGVAPLILPDAIPNLVHHGFGGGDIGVVGFGLAGAYGLAGSRRWLRWVLGLPAGGLAGLFALGGWRPGMEVSNPYGAWAATLITSLYLCFVVACTIPLRPAAAGFPAGVRPGSLVDSVHE